MSGRPAEISALGRWRAESMSLRPLSLSRMLDGRFPHVTVSERVLRVRVDAPAIALARCADAIVKPSIAQAYHDDTSRHHGHRRIIQRCWTQWSEGAVKRRGCGLRTAMVRHARLCSTTLLPTLTVSRYRVEKYRPVFLDDIVGNTETIERLKIIAKDGNMPHVIISGMPGIGKTTSVLCLARQLLGDAYKEAVLELNASDERGIDVVRNRIKGFAQKKVTLPPGRQKIVILDEADRCAL